MSLGQILYAEELAHERDQVLWACAAQDPKLLPRKKPAKANTGASKLKTYIDSQRTDGKVSPNTYIDARRKKPNVT